MDNETETDETENIPCDECGTEIEDGDGYTVGADTLCGDCTTVCESCENTIRASDAIGTYCDSCAGRCESCGAVTRFDDLDNYLCEDCREWCEACGQAYPYGSHDCPYAEDGRIHDYGYKPYPKFHTTADDPEDTTLFLGIEHELEAKQDVGDILDILDERAPWGLFYPKHDSSLSEGVEIVSHPMSRTYADTQYPFGMVDALARVAGHRDQNGESTAGVHIHISRAAFSSYHLYKFLHFHYTLADTVQRVAGRTDSQWATFRPEGHDGDAQKDTIIKQARGKVTNYNRYQCVNVQNDATIELRYFRSTVRGRRMHAYIQWVLAVFDYTGDSAIKVKCADRKREISEPGFAAWLTARGDQYPHALALYNGQEGY